MAKKTKILKNLKTKKNNKKRNLKKKISVKKIKGKGIDLSLLSATEFDKKYEKKPTRTVISLKREDKDSFNKKYVEDYRTSRLKKLSGPSLDNVLGGPLIPK